MQNCLPLNAIAGQPESAFRACRPFGGHVRGMDAIGRPTQPSESALVSLRLDGTVESWESGRKRLLIPPRSAEGAQLKNQ